MKANIMKFGSVAIISLYLRGLAALAVCALPILNATPVNAQAILENEDVQFRGLRTRVHFAWQKREFEKLEAWAAEFRTTNRRNSAASFLLPVFYDGFKEILVSTPVERAEQLWTAARNEWIAKFPNSPTPHIAHTYFLESLAWKARGGEYAYKVFPEAMAEYLKRLNEADHYLADNSAVASAEPSYELIRAVNQFQLKGDHRALLRGLDEGLRKHPGWLPYYYAGIRFLKQNWGGTPQLYWAWIDKALDASVQSDGTGILARMYNQSHGGPSNFADIENSGPLWPRMKQSIADSLERFPHWSNAKNYLYMACKARDAEVVTNLLAILVRNSQGASSPDIDAAKYCRWQSPGPQALPAPPKKDQRL